MNIFRNNSSQNQSSRGKSVGNKMFAYTGLRFFQTKFIQQLNAPLMTKTNTENWKIEISKPVKLKLDKENITPDIPKSVIKVKPPPLYTKIRGFHNIGNTCYLNSTLQCLVHLSSFNGSFDKDQYSKDAQKDYPVSKYYAQIVKQLIQGTSISPINPFQLKMSIGKKVPRFLGNSQQDAQQFLTAFLQTTNSQLSRIRQKPTYQQLNGNPQIKPLKQISQQWWQYYKKRDNSIICDYFTGQILSIVICKKCNTRSINFDNLWGIPINIYKNGKSIPQLLENHFKLENQIEDYNCSKCQKLRNCSKFVQFFKLPQILVIQLKRFQYGKLFKEKIKDSVKIQKQINMKKFINNESNQQDTKYKLTGMVHHFGETDFGHYTATVYDHNSKKWYDVNDSKTSENKDIQGLSKSVYLLFYEKKQ